MDMINSSNAGQSHYLHVLLSIDCRHQNIEIRDEKGYTPLIAGSMNGHTGVVSLLLEHGSNMHAQTFDKSTAYEAAIRLGHIEVIKILCNHDDPPNPRHITDTGFTGLMIAASQGNFQMAAILLAQGPPPRIMDRCTKGFFENMTAIGIAHYRGFPLLGHFLKRQAFYQESELVGKTLMLVSKLSWDMSLLIGKFVVPY